MANDRIRDAIGQHVERGVIPGAIAAVSRRGEVQVEIVGKQALEPAVAMRRDTLFRITSMTKPITAAAAMLLVEDGKLRLDDPVDTLLPELANRRVLARIDAPLDDTVAAVRAITLRDLLTFRFGFGIIWGPPDGTPIQRAANALQLGAFGPPKPLEPPAADEWMRRFGTLPLMHQPGERWMYQTGSEVVGVLVARAAGQPFDTFLRARLFEPLGMKDTGFGVPAGERHRLGPAYAPKDPFQPDSGELGIDDPADGDWVQTPAFPSGGAGLISTVDDYLAFATMLLHRGRHAGGRVLAESSVAAMTSDQLTAAQKAKSAMPGGDFWANHGWGFGMSVLTAPDELTAKPGRYGWDGGYGTSWANDPNEELVAILLTQRMAFPPMTAVNRDFWKAVYSA